MGVRCLCRAQEGGPELNIRRNNVTRHHFLRVKTPVGHFGRKKIKLKQQNGNMTLNLLRNPQD